MKKGCVIGLVALGLGVGSLKCGDDSTNPSSGPDLIGTWVADIPAGVVAPDTAVQLKAVFRADSSCSLTVLISQPSFPFPLYKEKDSRWFVRADSVFLVRTLCCPLNFAEWDYDTVDCQPDTGRLPATISGSSWTIPLRNLLVYLPVDIDTAGLQQNYGIMLTKQ